MKLKKMAKVMWTVVWDSSRMTRNGESWPYRLAFDRTGTRALTSPANSLRFLHMSPRL